MGLEAAYSRQASSGSGTTGATATLGASTLTRNILIGSAYSKVAPGSMAASGWTQVDEAALNASGDSVALWWKQATGAADSITITGGSTITQAGIFELQTAYIFGDSDLTGWTDYEDYWLGNKIENQGSSTDHETNGFAIGDASAGPYYRQGFTAQLCVQAVGLNNGNTSNVWSCYDAYQTGTTGTVLTPQTMNRHALSIGIIGNDTLWYEYEFAKMVTKSNTARSWGSVHMIIPVPFGTRAPMMGVG